MKDIESDIERFLVDHVRKLGGEAYKFVSPGNTGVPDRIVVLPDGSIIFTELKTDTGKLSATQKVQIMKLRRLGCDVRVLFGRDEVKSFIEAIERRLG